MGVLFSRSSQKSSGVRRGHYPTFGFKVLSLEVQAPSSQPSLEDLQTSKDEERQEVVALLFDKRSYSQKVSQASLGRCQGTRTSSRIEHNAVFLVMTIPFLRFLTAP